MARRTSTLWRGVARSLERCLEIFVLLYLFCLFVLCSSCLDFAKSKRPTSKILVSFIFIPSLLSRYDPKTNQWSSDVAPTSTCRTSVGVAVLGGYLYAVGGQDGVSCLNIVERYLSKLLCLASVHVTI